MAHLLLNGTGDYVSAPGLAAYNDPAFLDIRFDADPVSWTAGQVFIGRYHGATPLWRAQITTLPAIIISFLDSAGGGDTLTTAAVPLSGRTQVRLVLDLPDYTAYTKTTGDLWSDTGWTQAGTDTTIITDIRESASVEVQIGGRNEGTINPVTGKIYRAGFKTASGLVFDADPSDPNTWDCPDKLFFTDKANSATVTLQGDATLVGDCPPPPTPGGNRMGGTGAIRKPPRY